MSYNAVGFMVCFFAPRLLLFTNAGGEAARVAPAPMPPLAADARLHVFEGGRVLPTGPAVRLRATVAPTPAILQRRVSAYPAGCCIPAT